MLWSGQAAQPRRAEPRSRVHPAAPRSTTCFAHLARSAPRNLALCPAPHLCSLAQSRPRRARAKSFVVSCSLDARSLDLDAFAGGSAGPLQEHALHEEVSAGSLASLFVGALGRRLRQITQMSRDVFDRSRQRNAAAVSAQRSNAQTETKTNVDAAELARKPLRLAECPEDPNLNVLQSHSTEGRPDPLDLDGQSVLRRHLGARERTSGPSARHAASRSARPAPPHMAIFFFDHIRGSSLNARKATPPSRTLPHLPRVAK